MPTLAGKKFEFVGVFIIAVMAIFLSVQPAKAGMEVQITSSLQDQKYPAISGDKIVWQEYRGGTNNIYLYNLNTQTETEISHGQGSGSYTPAIDGDKIVWVDYRHGVSNAAIYMYDLSAQAETLISTGAGIYYNPQIFGDRIVWFDIRNGGANADVFMYDLATHTETPIATAQNGQYYPKISGDKIVWQDYRNYYNGYYNPNIYMHDLATGLEWRITTNMTGQEYPSVSGDRIVWQDYRNARDNDNTDVYMYDLVSQAETRITTNTRWQGTPIVLAERIFWIDNRNGNGDVYMYDIATQTENRITSGSAQARNLQISGDKIVWQDYRNGNADIYMYDLNPNVSPTAQIVPVTTVILGQSVTFDGSGSNDSDGAITSYAWDFGDGTNGVGVTANHTYGAAGSYTVVLTVTDDDGATGTATTSVEVSAPPVAVIAPVTEVAHGQTSTFDATGSTDADGTIVSYSWNFGDGNTGTGATTTHTYAEPGTYAVTLTVTDNDGATDSETIGVTVDALPEAFITPIATVTVGEETNFDGSGSSDPDGNIVSYVWNFGDNSTGSGETAVHTYAAAGSYAVTLMVTDDFGSTSTATATAVVQTPVQAINDLMDLVESMNLAQGISNSLDSKLENAADALEAMNAGSTNSAVSKLQAFINACEAQSGNAMTVEQANQLIAVANRIIAALTGQ